MALSPADITQIINLISTQLAANRIKISALPAIGAVSRDAVSPWVDSGSTQKMTLAQLLAKGNTYVSTGQGLRNMDVSTVEDGTVFVIGGVDTVGDGGFGEWLYDASSVAADNIGTVIPPDSGTGRFLRQYDGWVNVKWFGAKGDGVTNDTAAINSAIAFCGSSGATLFIPAGTYMVDGVAITAIQGFTMCGEGPEKTIFAARAGCSAVIQMSGVLHGLALSDFRIDGTLGNGRGLYFNNTGGGTLDNSRFERIKAISCATRGFDFSTGFSYVARDLVASGSGGHQIMAKGGPAVLFENCSWGSTATGFAGLRILQSAIVISCNGDYSASSGDWGRFGGDGSPESDDTLAFPSIHFLTCNIEDFTATGMRFITEPNGTILDHCKFLASGAGGGALNTVAVQFNDFFPGNPAIFRNCEFSLNTGATFKNSNPIHTLGGTVCVCGIGNNQYNTFYNDSTMLEYPILTEIQNASLSPLYSLYAMQSRVIKGGVELDYCARLNWGNPADGDTVMNWFASPGRNSIPASGTWTIGTIVWRTGSKFEAGAPGSAYILLGWVRITAGSGNVLNVDWMEIRVLTGN